MNQLTDEHVFQFRDIRSAGPWLMSFMSLVPLREDMTIVHRGMENISAGGVTESIN